MRDLPSSLHDVSLDVGPRVEAVQQLPVPGKLGVPPGGCRVAGESQDDNQDHSHPPHHGPAPEKHRVSGSKFIRLILLESHQVFNLNIDLAGI